MPYNTTALPPRKEVTGQTQLPLARVKKIIAMDSDIAMCSNNAAFVITLATEMFIQHMAEKGHDVVKSERKPRKNIQYKDLASAVARHDRLEFLSDIVPQTQTYKQFKEASKKARQTNGVAIEAGQTTIDGKRPLNGSHGGSRFDGADDTLDDDSGSGDANTQLEMELRGRNSIGSIIDSTPPTNGNMNGSRVSNGPPADEDVEMS